MVFQKSPAQQRHVLLAACRKVYTGKRSENCKIQGRNIHLSKMKADWLSAMHTGDGPSINNGQPQIGRQGRIYATLRSACVNQPWIQVRRQESVWPAYGIEGGIKANLDRQGWPHLS